MRLSTSTCIFPTYYNTKQAQPFEETIELAAECGFRVFDANFCGATHDKSLGHLIAQDNWEQLVDGVRNFSENKGISFSQSHLPYNANFYMRGKVPTQEYCQMFNEMSRRSLIASKMLGVKWAVIHPLTNNIDGELDLETNIRTNMEFYSWLVELANKHNVGLAIENMAEFDPVNCKRRFAAQAEELIALVERFNDPLVGACWDYGHGNMVYKDQKAPLRKIGKLLKATHVDENNGSQDLHSLPFFVGKTDWKELMPILKEIGYEGDFTYEIHGFSQNAPDELRIKAAKFAYDVGMYLISLYENS